MIDDLLTVDLLGEGVLVRVASLGAARVGDGYALDPDAAESLAEELLRAVAELRRGRMISDGVGWCAACGRELVAVTSGDTCPVCLAAS